MHVIGAGLPRTGTLTQKLAVEMLGLGPCYHWVDVLADLDRVEQWHRALDGEAPWGEIFDGFRRDGRLAGRVLLPIELAEAYPEAKVVLSVRDPQKWVEELPRDDLGDRIRRMLIRYLSNARAQIDPRWPRYLQLVDRMFWIENGTFAGATRQRPDDRGDGAPSRRGARGIAPERLLDWDVTEGWEPLCRFLGVAVPDEPLPHANDRETFTSASSAARSTRSRAGTRAARSSHQGIRRSTMSSSWRTSTAA